MAPLIRKIRQADCFELKVCVTAQHREMLDMALALFAISPDHDLDLMSDSQTITEITVRALAGLEIVFKQEKPDLVLVHGDTTTTCSAALAAFYQKTAVGHVEAGLRSGNIYSPYPEEMNRRITTAIAGLHFAPTEGNRRNLLHCGVDPERIFVTGNTVIDALHLVARKEYIFAEAALNRLDYAHKKIILLTAHRRENWGRPLGNIYAAMRTLLSNNPDTELVFPVHMNPVVKEAAHRALGAVPGAHLTHPLDYEPFVNLMARSYLVLTDSGGIQEEAPALGKPVLVLRAETERPEAVEAGTVKLAGTEKDQIVSLAQELLTNKAEYEKMARAVNPYGDGNAAERIVNILRAHFFADQEKQGVAGLYSGY